MRSYCLVIIILGGSILSFGQGKTRLMHKAQNCFDEKDYACAESALIKALMLDSTNHFLINNLGVVQQRLNKPEAALVSYTKVLELVPDDILALNNKAAILDYFKDYEGALYLLNRANQRSSFNETTLLTRAAVYQHLKNPGAAFSDLKSILQINPKHWNARLKIALLKFDLGDFVGAKVDFIAILFDYPEDAISLNSLAKIELYNMNFKEALDYSNKAIKINSKYVSAYLTRGQIELKLNQKDLACEDFKYAKKIDTSNEMDCHAVYLAECDK